MVTVLAVLTCISSFRRVTGKSGDWWPPQLRFSLEMSANSPAVLVRRLLSRFPEVCSMWTTVNAVTVLVRGSPFHVAAACRTVQLRFSRVEVQFLFSLSRRSQKLVPLD